MQTSKIILNAVYCIKCKEVVESTHRHDFRYCSCGAVAVDGGKAYLRRVGDIYGCVDVSLYEGKEDVLNEYRKVGKAALLEARMADIGGPSIDNDKLLGEFKEASAAQQKRMVQGSGADAA